MARARSLLRSTLLALLAGLLASNSSCLFRSDTSDEGEKPPEEGPPPQLRLRLVPLPAPPPVPVRLVLVGGRAAQR